MSITVYKTLSSPLEQLQPLKESLSITETLNSRATCDFRITLAPGENPPPVGTAISAYDGSSLIFAGLIQAVSRALIGKTGSIRVVSITASDYTCLADYRSAGEYSWTNAKANDIARALISTGLDGDAVNLNLVAAGGGPTIEEFKVVYPTVAEALTALCQLAGRNWRINYDRELEFYSPTDLSIISTFVDGDCPALMQAGLSVSEDMSMYANRVLVILGAYLTDERTESFPGSPADQAPDGSRTEWTLDYPVASAPIVKVNGTLQTVGVDGVDTAKQWYWSKGSEQIRQESTDTPLAAGTTLDVTYIGTTTAKVSAQNNEEVDARAAIEGTSGIHTKVINYDQEVLAGRGQDIADQLLAKYDEVSYVMRFETYTLYPSVGQRITCNVTGYPTGDYTIRSVTSFDEGGGTLRRSIEAVKGPLLLNGADFFRWLTGTKGTSGGVAAPPAASDSAAPSAPTAPTLPTITVAYGNALDFTLTAGWTAPASTSNVGFDVEFQWSESDGDAGWKAPGDWMSQQHVTGELTAEAIFGPFLRSTATARARIRVRSVNSANDASAWTTESAWATVAGADMNDGENLIRNGNFDLLFAFWIEPQEKLWISSDAGLGGGICGAIASGEIVYLKQAAMPCTAGDQLTMRVWYKASADAVFDPAYPHVYFGVRFYDSTGSILNALTGDSGVVGEEWAQSEITITAPAGAVSMQFTAAQTKLTAGNLYVDGVYCARSAAAGEYDWEGVAWLDGDLSAAAEQGAPLRISLDAGKVLSFVETGVTLGTAPTGSAAGFGWEYSTDGGANWAELLTAALEVDAGEIEGTSTAFNEVTLEDGDYLRAKCSSVGSTSPGAYARIYIRGTVA